MIETPVLHRRDPRLFLQIRASLCNRAASRYIRV
jgi:hypothetical protein